MFSSTRRDALHSCWCSTTSAEAGSASATDLHEVAIDWKTPEEAAEDESKASLAEDVGQVLRHCHAELCERLDSWMERQDKAIESVIACQEKLLAATRGLPVPQVASAASSAGGSRREPSSIEVHRESVGLLAVSPLLASSACMHKSMSNLSTLGEQHIFDEPLQARPFDNHPMPSMQILPGRATKLSTMRKYHSDDEAVTRKPSTQPFWKTLSLTWAPAVPWIQTEPSGERSERLGDLHDVSSEPSNAATILTRSTCRETGRHRRTQEFAHTKSEEDRLRKSKAVTETMDRRARTLAEETLNMSYSKGFSYHLMTQGWIWSCVHSGPFTLVLLVLMIAYMVFLGVQITYVTSANHDEFFWINLVFALLFTAEIMLRVASDGLVFLRRRRHVFDVLVAVAALGDACFHRTYPDSQLKMVNILRVAHFARIFRTLSIKRLAKFLRSVRVLTQSAVGCWRPLSCGLLVHAMIIYLFALVFTEAARNPELSKSLSAQDLEKLDKYYGSVLLSCLCLFQATTAGLDWAEAMEPLTKISFVYTILFVAFIMFVYFAVLNVFTAHFCQQAIATAQKDNDNVIQEHIQQKTEYTNQLRQLFKEIDTTSSGALTLGDFEQSLTDERIESFFESLGIEISDAWTIFKLLDRNSTQAVNLEEFIVGCLRLRGTARSVDILKLTYDIEWLTKKMGLVFERTTSEPSSSVLERLTLGPADTSGAMTYKGGPSRWWS